MLRQRKAFLNQYKNETMFENGFEPFDEAKAAVTDLIDEYRAAEKADYVVRGNAFCRRGVGGGEEDTFADGLSFLPSFLPSFLYALDTSSASPSHTNTGLRRPSSCLTTLSHSLVLPLRLSPLV
jgi:hypothetical protein